MLILPLKWSLNTLRYLFLALRYLYIQNLELNRPITTIMLITYIKVKYIFINWQMPSIIKKIFEQRTYGTWDQREHLLNWTADAVSTWFDTITSLGSPSKITLVAILTSIITPTSCFCACSVSVYKQDLPIIWQISCWKQMAYCTQKWLKSWTKNIFTHVSKGPSKNVNMFTSVQTVR